MNGANRKPRVKPNKQFFDHLLEDRQMSQRQLAKLMQLDQSSLNRALLGKREFKPAEVGQMARILNVPLIVILSNLGIGNQEELGQAWVEVVSKNVYLRHVLTELLAEVEWANEMNKKSGHLISEDYIKRAKVALSPPSKKAMTVGFQAEHHDSDAVDGSH